MTIDAADLAVPVSDADHSAGPPAAPVTLVEYGDYECPACLNAEPMVDEVRRRLGDRVRVIFRHFPQNSVHARASAAAEAAEAAASQGKFWPFHHALFAKQAELAEVDLNHLALNAGLDVYKFGRDLGSGVYAPRVRADYDGGVRSGVDGTPTFFINGRRFAGRVTIERLLVAIEAVPA